MNVGSVARRQRIAAAWTLAALLAGLLLFVWLVPQIIAVLNDAGVTRLPPYAKTLIQISNFITTKWYMVVCPLALIVALLLSRLITR